MSSMSSMGSTTVSRRQVKATGQARPAQRPAPASQRDDLPDSRAAKTAVPLLFNRSSSRSRPVVTSAPWWKTWLVVTLANLLAVGVCFGAYTWVQSAGGSESRAVEPQRAYAAPLSMVNIRPMGLSSPGRSLPSSASQGGGAGGYAPGASPSVDLSDPATLDGSNKLVLPSNVSGKCDIGDSGVKDFGRCLSQNGARPGNAP